MDALGDFIRRHDDYQFEVKLGYDLHRDRRKERYAVDYYFFLPDNLDVNASTYTKEQFYRDMLLYLRFMAPDLSLEELADGADERSPLRRIRVKLDAYRAAPGDYNAVVLEYELKLLGCALKDALGDVLRELREELAKGDASPAAAVRLAGSGRGVAQAFRALRKDFESPALPEVLRSAYAFIDEYASVLLEGRAHLMMRDAQRLPGPLPGWTAPLAALIEEETAYRRGRGFPSLAAEESDNEALVYRMSLLKKYAASALHLSVRTEKEGRGIDHLGLALGSGLAMIFYTAVAFYYQRVYGTLSLGFFLAVVIGYMFRDRIKAVAEAYFLRFRSDRLMDLSTDIVDPFSKGLIGECRELVHFIPEPKIDPLAHALRHRDHVTEIEGLWRSEQVLHYRKEITLTPGRLDPHSRKNALVDIARFNIRNFLLKMDEPRMELFLLREARSTPVPAARVYHVNLVIKFTGATDVRYERVRLVLDQDGIKRLEPVSSETRPHP